GGARNEVPLTAEKAAQQIAIVGIVVHDEYGSCLTASHRAGRLRSGWRGHRFRSAIQVCLAGVFDQSDDFIEAGERLFAQTVYFAEVGEKAIEKERFSILQPQFTVADNVRQRRAQFVAE